MLGKPSNHITTLDDIKGWLLQWRLNRIVRFFNKELDVTLNSVTVSEDSKAFILVFRKTPQSFLELTVSNIHKFAWQYEWNIASPGFQTSIKSESYKDFSKAILKIL